jgi:ribosomal protein S21
VTLGIRIEVGYDEPIADALRRFRKLILANGAFPLYHCKWHKPRRDLYQKPSVLRRRRRWITVVRKRGRGLYSPDPDYDWADDLLLKPRRRSASP